MAMKEETPVQPTHQRVVLDPNASDSEFKIQTVAAIVLQDHKIGSLERGQQKLTDLVTEGFEGVRAHQRRQDERLSGVGQVSAKSVFSGTIAMIGALNIVFVAAVTIGVVYVGLKTGPINEKIDEETKDRKATDITVTAQGKEISSIKSNLNGLGERLDGIDTRITDSNAALYEKADDMEKLMRALDGAKD